MLSLMKSSMTGEIDQRLKVLIAPTEDPGSQHLHGGSQL